MNQQKPRKAHVLWEGKASHYSNDAHVYRIVAIHQEPDLNEIEVDSSWDDVTIVTERLAADACGARAWAHDGRWDGPSTVGLVHFMLQGPHTVPEWLRVWYNRQRDLPIAPPRASR